MSNHEALSRALIICKEARIKDIDEEIKRTRTDRTYTHTEVPPGLPKAMENIANADEERSIDLASKFISSTKQ